MSLFSISKQLSEKRGVLFYYSIINTFLWKISKEKRGRNRLGIKCMDVLGLKSILYTAYLDSVVE